MHEEWVMHDGTKCTCTTPLPLSGGMRPDVARGARSGALECHIEATFSPAGKSMDRRPTEAGAGPPFEVKKTVLKKTESSACPSAYWCWHSY